MVSKNVAKDLEKQIRYAKTSRSARGLLYQAHGAIIMAYDLDAISADEYLALEHECVAEGINSPEYF